MTPANRAAEPDEPRQSTAALLAGLLSHIGLQATATTKPASTSAPAAPGSRSSPARRCAKKPPRWVMAAELVETSRLLARIAARIEPEWVEQLAGHLVKRSYSEPHWERQARLGGGLRAGHASTGCRSSPAAGSHYGRSTRSCLARAVHPARPGRGRLADAPPRSSPTTARCSSEVAELEDAGPPPRHPGRRRDAVRRSTTRGSPPTSSPARHFDSWWKKARRDRRRTCSTFTPAMLDQRAARAGRTGGLSRTRGAPAAHPAADLPVRAGRRRRRRHRRRAARRARPASPPTPGSTGRCPGLREELVDGAARALPKQLRRAARAGARPRARASCRLRLDPVPASRCCRPWSASCAGRRRRRPAATPGDLDRVPDHLRVTFRVLDDEQRTLAEGKDLAALRAAAGAAGAGQRWPRAGAGPASAPACAPGTFGTLPQTVQQEQAGHAGHRLPGAGGRGRHRRRPGASPPRPSSGRPMWAGTRRLLLLARAAARQVGAGGLDRAAGWRWPQPGRESPRPGRRLRRPRRRRADRRRRRAALGRGRLRPRCREAARAQLLDATARRGRPGRGGADPGPRRSRRGWPAGAGAAATRVADLRAPAGRPAAPGLRHRDRRAAGCPTCPLPAGDGRRLEKLPADPARDRDWMRRGRAEVRPSTSELRSHCRPTRRRPGLHADPLDDRGAAGQPVRPGARAPPYPVSEQRIYKAIDELTGPPR